MIFRPRSYAAYVGRRREAMADDAHGVNRRCACQCNRGDRICPRHAPNLYTLGGAQHRREGVAT